MRRRLQRLMIVLAAVAGMANAAQAQGIAINETNFPDENFRTHVKQYDTDSDGFLGSDEIAAVTFIEVDNKDVADLKGIEHFTSLQSLYCGINKLTSLDVSANTALTFLNCSHNQLTLLDVSANTKLKNLYCVGNKLIALDVATNTGLTVLNCGTNKLTSLDVSANTALTFLICSYNQLTSLDVSANTQLTKLYCNSNQLTALDVSKNIALTTLECYSNQIQGNEMLALVNRLPLVTSGEFYVVDTKDSKEKNSITKAQVAIATAKNWTVYDYNRNSKVEYAGNPGIEINETNFPDQNFRNYVSSTHDTDSDGYLSYEEIAAVSSMSISWKNITNLKGIEHFTALTTLSCYENQLTTLDVSNNTALERLDCSDNQLTALDVSANIALETLRCDNNQLNALDVSANTALTELYCPSNQLTELDVRANTALETLRCDNNQLNALDVSANTALTYLSCPSNQLSTLVMSNCTALTSLSCSYNQLNALDVSANTALTYLSCFSNQLNALDVSANTALTRLVCSSNQLTSLVVSANTALTDLVCYGNQIQGDEMLALVNSLPTVSSGEFYVVNARNSGVDNIITKSQVAIAMGKRWSVHHSAGDSYYGVEEYALTLGLPTNGTFTATPNGNVGEGTTVVLTAAPEEGYKLKSLKAYMTGDESQAVSITNNKFTMPAYAVTVEAEFEEIPTYTLTVVTPTNGTLIANPSGNVVEGTEVTLTVTSDEGYKLKTLKAYKTGDESTMVAISENKFTMPAYDVTVEAEFEAITYTLTYTADAGGTIVGSATQTVQHGQSGTGVEAKPNDGYRFVKWSDGNTNAKRTDSNVRDNLSVTAEFEKVAATGLFNVKQESLSLSVHPNPTRGAVQVEATGVVLVYNVASQLLQRVPSQGKVLIDLSA